MYFEEAGSGVGVRVRVWLRVDWGGFFRFGFRCLLGFSFLGFRVSELIGRKGFYRVRRIERLGG